jgi:UDP-N-acetyl-D-glucosamine dehydrogenase
MLLREKGADVQYHDPYLPTFQKDGVDMASITDLASCLEEADAVVIATDHSDYEPLDILEKAAVVVDTRHMIESWRERSSDSSDQ